jgi:hypothetical protein
MRLLSLVRIELLHPFFCDRPREFIHCVLICWKPVVPQERGFVAVHDLQDPRVFVFSTIDVDPNGNAITLLRTPEQ